MEFTATESGFEHGMGGASNAECTAENHYVLFGRQADEQHPECRGTYFEFDDQVNGNVNCVAAVTIMDHDVKFDLRSGQAILVRCGTPDPQWSEFLKGIDDVFGDLVVRTG
jgi:hypothetical protein